MSKLQEAKAAAAAARAEIERELNHLARAREIVQSRSEIVDAAEGFFESPFDFNSEAVEDLCEFIRDITDALGVAND